MNKFFLLIACLAMVLTSVAFTSCDKDNDTKPFFPEDAITTYTISREILADGMFDETLYINELVKFIQEKVGRDAQVDTYTINTEKPEVVEKVLGTITVADLERIAKQIDPSIYYVYVKIRKGADVIVDLTYSKGSNAPADHVGAYTYTEDGKTFTFELSKTPAAEQGYYMSTFIVPEGFEGIEAGTYTGKARAFAQKYVQFESDRLKEGSTISYLKFVLDVVNTESGNYSGNISVNGRAWKVQLPFSKK